MVMFYLYLVSFFPHGLLGKLILYDYHVHIFMSAQLYL
jgi:hypothetical protein